MEGIRAEREQKREKEGEREWPISEKKIVFNIN